MTAPQPSLFPTAVPHHVSALESPRRVTATPVAQTSDRRDPPASLPPGNSGSGPLVFEFDLLTTSESNARGANDWSRDRIVREQVTAVLSSLCRCHAVRHLARKPQKGKKDKITKKVISPPPGTSFKEIVAALARECRCVRLVFPWRVTLTRVAAGQLDKDNLGGALKHVQDAVARWARVDDAKAEVVDYVRLQEKAKPKVCRMRIRIEHWGLLEERAELRRKLVVLDDRIARGET